MTEIYDARWPSTMRGLARGAARGAAREELQWLDAQEQDAEDLWWALVSEEVPSTTTTTSTVEPLELIFKGITFATSERAGVVVVSWRPVVVNSSGESPTNHSHQSVQYALLYADGAYNFTGLDTAASLQNYSGARVLMHSWEVLNTSLEAEPNSTLSLLVLALVPGQMSKNRQATRVVVAAEDPVLADNVTALVEVSHSAALEVSLRNSSHAPGGRIVTLSRVWGHGGDGLPSLEPGACVSGISSEEEPFLVAVEAVESLSESSISLRAHVVRIVDVFQRIHVDSSLQVDASDPEEAEANTEVNEVNNSEGNSASLPWLDVSFGFLEKCQVRPEINTRFKFDMDSIFSLSLSFHVDVAVSASCRLRISKTLWEDSIEIDMLAKLKKMPKWIKKGLRVVKRYGPAVWLTLIPSKMVLFLRGQVQMAEFGADVTFDDRRSFGFEMQGWKWSSYMSEPTSSAAWEPMDPTDLLTGTLSVTAGSGLGYVWWISNIHDIGFSLMLETHMLHFEVQVEPIPLPLQMTSGLPRLGVKPVVFTKLDLSVKPVAIVFKFQCKAESSGFLSLFCKTIGETIDILTFVPLSIPLVALPSLDIQATEGAACGVTVKESYGWISPLLKPLLPLSSSKSRWLVASDDSFGVEFRPNNGVVAVLYVDDVLRDHPPNYLSEKTVYYYRFSSAFPWLAMVVAKRFGQLWDGSCVKFSSEAPCQHVLSQEEAYQLAACGSSALLSSTL